MKQYLMPGAASKHFINNKTLKQLYHALVRFESNWISKTFPIVQPVGECYCLRGFLVIHVGFFFLLATMLVVLESVKFGLGKVDFILHR